jgi:hypothetical protein
VLEFLEDSLKRKEEKNRNRHSVLLDVQGSGKKVRQSGRVGNQSRTLFPFEQLQ